MPVEPAPAARAVVFNFEAFDPKTTTWVRWVKRFETAVEIYNGGTDAVKRRQLILHYMGAAIYNVLCDKLLPREPESVPYTEIISILTEHFDPRPNEILENYRFHCRKQKLDETSADFLTALRRLAVNCGFGTYLDTALRNQFVFGLKNQSVQSRLLEKKTLTISEASNVASSYEIAGKGGMELQHRWENGERGVVNKLQGGKYKNSQRNGQNSHTPINISKQKNKCFRCGSTEHMADKCQYSENVCHFCKKRGHLKKACFKAKKQINNIEEETKAETVVVDELYHVEEAMAIRQKVCCVLEVNKKKINFEIDTGAPVTILGLEDAKKYFSKFKVNASDIKLYSYCKTLIDCLGFIWVDVTSNGKKYQLKLYIVRSDRQPLLGREWLRSIKLNWTSMLNNQLNVNQLQGESRTYDVSLESFIHEFPTVFSSTPGKIIGFQARLYLKPDVKPKFIKARRVAFPLWEKVEKELDNQIAEGLLLKVDKNEWATPIVVVPKADGSVRICGDYKVTVNQSLLVDEHPLPTIEELFAKMAGGMKFTKIDLSKAYLQLEVDPADRNMLTLNTHKGLFTPTRLMFGVACAPAKWQRLMEQILGDMVGVSVYLDDIKITAADDVTHMQRIEEVLRRLEKHNMRVNLKKSEFMKDQIEYCGYVIDKNGIRPMKNKIDAIHNMKKPTNKEEVRSFLGLINYYGRFVKGLSNIVYPLNNLLRNEVPFKFNEECEKAFNNVKKQMQTDTLLTHYDPKKTVVLAVDASPIGVGAVLSHVVEDGSEKPLQFASQTLSSVQQRYSQVDKEAYAIIFGVRKFYQYLYGKKCILVTDNKAISQIFSPNKGIPILSATRMQHYAIYLSHFDYEIRLKKSKDNANADAMSRLPVEDTYRNIEEVDVIEINAIENLPVTVEELSEVTKLDKEVKKLRECLRYGRECEGKDRFGISQEEFALQRGCILRGIRVYIPMPVRERVLRELHTAHFGISKMKSLARAYCWWNGMDSDIEKMVANCAQCQMITPNPQKESPTHCWLPAKRVFERVHADFAGPFLGKYLFVMVDAYSKWPEVHIISNITAETTIRKCEEIFATFGIPNSFVSDHGTQFNSKEFQDFLRNNGIQHKQGAPYHPATNGQAERFIQTVKNKLKSANCTAASMNKELLRILMAYRRAIHPATNKSPAMLMFGRQIQSRLELMLPSYIVEPQTRQKSQKNFAVGQKVAVRDYLSAIKWRFGKIVSVIGNLHYIVLLDDGRIWKRHVEQIRCIGDNIGANPVDKSSNTEIFHRTQAPDSIVEQNTVSPGNDEVIVESSENVDRGEAGPSENLECEAGPSENLECAEAEPQVENSFRGGREQAQETPLRRSTRERRPPTYLQEYSK